jgi:hypothetical protein
MTTPTRIFGEWTGSQSHAANLLEGGPQTIIVPHVSGHEGGVISDRLLAVLPAPKYKDEHRAVVLMAHGVYFTLDGDPAIDPDQVESLIHFIWVRPLGYRFRVIVALLSQRPDPPWMIVRDPNLQDSRDPWRSPPTGR